MLKFSIWTIFSSLVATTNQKTRFIVASGIAGKEIESDFAPFFFVAAINLWVHSRFSLHFFPSIAKTTTSPDWRRNLREVLNLA